MEIPGKMRTHKYAELEKDKRSISRLNGRKHAEFM